MELSGFNLGRLWGSASHRLLLASYLNCADFVCLVLSFLDPEPWCCGDTGFEHERSRELPLLTELSAGEKVVSCIQRVKWVADLEIRVIHDTLAEGATAATVMRL